MDTNTPLAPTGPSTFKNPATYAGESVCPRCGSGWPCCADARPDGAKYTHAETCARYRDTDDACARCERHMLIEDATETRQLREAVARVRTLATTHDDGRRRESGAGWLVPVSRILAALDRDRKTESDMAVDQRTIELGG